MAVPPNELTEIWHKFCEDLKAAGLPVLSSSLPNSELEQAEGLRYLTRLMRIGLEMHLEYADPAFPVFYQASHASAKIGSDNPDNFYQNATISGAHSYRIWGERGTVPILSFATKANRYAIDGSMASTGEIDIRDVELGPNGHFEIIVSREKQSKNWLPLEEDSSILIVRQTFLERDKETPATVQITAINETGARAAPLSLPHLSAALTKVPRFISGTSAVFRDWAEGFRTENKNQLNTVDQSMFIRAGGDPMIYYLHGWWELAEGESLQITAPIPDCEAWNFQINNIWMESLDYRHHTIHTNNRLAVPNDDGTITLTLGAKPYGLNWIDTNAHKKGTMLWRWTGAKYHPLPQTKIISAKDATQKDDRHV